MADCIRERLRASLVETGVHHVRRRIERLQRRRG
jgi:hypothetical protein